MSARSVQAATRYARSKERVAMRRRREPEGVARHDGGRRGRAIRTRGVRSDDGSKALRRKRPPNFGAAGLSVDKRFRRARAADLAAVAKGGTTSNGSAKAECVCSFGATRVGTMIERVRLHVATARFLAARRGDSMWEVASDSAALALGRLASRLKPWELEEWICATTGAGQSGPAVVCSENPLEAKLTREAFAGLGQVARLAAFGGRSARTPAAGRAACGASCGGQQ